MGSRPGDAAHLVALRSASEALDGGDDEVHAVLPHLLWHVAVLPSTTCGISSVWAPASVKPWSRVGARTLISGYCICFRSISSEEGSASVMVAGLSGGRVGVRTIGWSRGRQRRALGWVRLGRVAAHASSATSTRTRNPSAPTQASAVGAGLLTHEHDAALHLGRRLPAVLRLYRGLREGGHPFHNLFHSTFSTLSTPSFVRQGLSDLCNLPPPFEKVKWP